MFVADIVIWPHGNHHYPIPHTRIVACNDGTGNRDSGNYQAIAIQAFETTREFPEPTECINRLLTAMDDGTAVEVLGFPRAREQQHLPALVVAITQALGLDEVKVDG
jgi:hypothetical protein